MSKVNTYNQLRTRKCVQTLHKSIRIYMGVIINTSNIKFCLLKKIPMASKGLSIRLAVLQFVNCAANRHGCIGLVTFYALNTQFTNSLEKVHMHTHAHTLMVKISVSVRNEMLT